MHRCLILIVSLITFSFSKTDFNFKIIPTLVNPSLDCWYKVPQGVVPQISTVDTVSQNQFISLPIAFSNYTAVNNHVNITYDLFVTGPDGLKTSDSARGIPAINSQIPDPKVLLFPQTLVRLSFSDKYKEGKYIIHITGYDNNAKTSKTDSISVVMTKFRKFPPFASQMECSKWIMHYYLQPQPERLLNAITLLTPVDNKNIINRLGGIKFFTQVYEDNPFVVKEIRKAFAGLSLSDKKRVLVIDHLSSIKQFKESELKEKSLKHFFNQLQKVSFPSMDKIEEPKQLDMLWSQLFAQGTIEPLYKLVSVLKPHKSDKSMQDLKNDKTKNKAEYLKEVYKVATYDSAIWSLTSNCISSPLVYNFCFVLAHNSDVDEDIKKTLLAILVKAGKEIEKSTPKN